MSHNFNLINADTDSILIGKPDNSPFSDEEQKSLLEELNSLYPKLIRFEDDGYFSRVIITKAKNYVMKDAVTGKIKIKGSSFMDQKKEPALQQLMKDFAYSILDDGVNYMNLTAIYDKYAQQVINGVQDIKPWCSKKTITSKILNCAGHETMTKEERKEKGIRKNESDVWDAVKGIATQEGDKVYLYPVQLDPIVETGRISKKGKPLKDKVTANNGLRLAQEWKFGDEDRVKLLERIHSTVLILNKVLDMSNFRNYVLDFESERD